MTDSHETRMTTRMTDQPRRFHLQRDVDVTGISGTGVVALGVRWPDGTASVRWLGDRPSIVFWDDMDDAEAVHGHGGATRIVWTDEEQLPLAERAAVLREAYEVAFTEGMRLNTMEAKIGVGPYRGALCVARLLRLLADQAQQAPAEEEAQQDGPTASTAVLSDGERQFLTFTLDLAADEMAVGDGFTDEDTAALAKLRRMADEAEGSTS